MVPSKYSYHFLIGFIIVFLLSVFAIIFLWRYFAIQDQLLNQYQREFEKKSWTNLELFHEGTSKLAMSVFEKSSSTLYLLSRDETLQDSLARNDLSAVQATLDRQRVINQTFNSWVILDRTGKNLVASSDLPESQKFVGQNFSEREYFQQALSLSESDTIYVSELLRGKAGRLGITMSAPIRQADGTISHVLVASITVQTLAARIHLSSQFTDVYGILVDQKGNVLLNKGDEPKEVVNITDQSPVLSRLLNGETSVLEENFNFKKEHVLAIGTPLQIGSQKVFLISYYPKEQFQAELDGFKNQFFRIYSHLFLLIVFIMLPILVLVFFIVGRHEMVTHRS